MTLKKFAIPISDPSKMIISAEPNTLSYFHEEAHIKFNESNLGMNIQWIGEISQFYTLILVVVALFFDPAKYVCIIGILLMIGSFIFEEIWCDNYADKKYKSLNTPSNN